MIQAIRVSVVSAVATQIRVAAAFEHDSRALFARKAGVFVAFAFSDRTARVS